MSDYTHQVAVIGFVLHEDRFLLLKRNTPPLVWGPPGGRLHAGEDPIAGLHREIYEETRLRTTIIGLTDTWFGDVGDGKLLLSLDYVVAYQEGEVSLSDEHTDFAWLTIAELSCGDPVALDDTTGFQTADFQHALNIASFYRQDETR